MSWAINRPDVEHGGRWMPAPKSGLVEKIGADKYITKARKASELAQDDTVPDPENSFMTCPRCGDTGPILEHWDHAECSCGLNMEVTGGALTIWLAPRLVKLS